MQQIIDQPDTLPDTMSDLLAATIADARKLDTTLYHPHCQEWHTAWDHGPCQICLTGSVIAGALDAPHSQTFCPRMFKGAIQRKLESLNYMRLGKWILAFKTFHQRWPKIPAARLLCHLPSPDNKNFSGWRQFNQHLDSLESILDELREIETSEAHI